VNRPLSDVGHNRYNTKADLILAFLEVSEIKRFRATNSLRASKID